MGWVCGAERGEVAVDSTGCGMLSTQSLRAWTCGDTAELPPDEREGLEPVCVVQYEEVCAGVQPHHPASTVTMSSPLPSTHKQAA